MTKIVELPFHDKTGTLTPLVVEAMANGAVSNNHPTDPNLITLTFKTAKEADAFRELIAASENAE